MAPRTRAQRKRAREEEQEEEEEEEDCCICFEPLSSSSVHSLPCDHRLCVDCFNGLVNKAAEVAEDEGARSSRLGTSVSCPLCRAKSRCKRLRTE